MRRTAHADNLAATYAATTRVVTGLEETNFLRPTRCRGWAICDLLFHMLLDAQRALVALATPAEGPPDVDSVAYWRSFSNEDPSALAHARFVRISASAHSSPMQIAGRWKETSAAAVRSARASAPESFISTQGHVLAVHDFVATLTVEAAIHHLDLVVDLPGAEGPDPAGLQVVRATLDGLIGAPLPTRWDDSTYALKATGREHLTEDERFALGPAADRLPVFS
jgi:uncharacterized protein (TIGR03083 family)